jgi:hypothetical protein
VVLRRVLRSKDLPSSYRLAHPAASLVPSASSALRSPARYAGSVRGGRCSDLSAACLRYYGGSDFCRGAICALLSRQISCVHGMLLARPTMTNHTILPVGAGRCRRPKVDPLAGVETSSFARGLVVLMVPNRLHFCYGRSGSFGCSPPRLAATRLLQVLTRPTVADGQGLSPRRSVQLHSARAASVPAPTINRRRAAHLLERAFATRSRKGSAAARD